MKRQLEGNTIQVHRPIYSRTHFEDTYKERECASRADGVRHTLHRRLRVWARASCTWSLLRKLKTYERRDFAADALAGTLIGLIYISQGLMFGTLANLPPVYGLYTTFFPAILYALFGTSSHLSIGSFALTSQLVGSAVQAAGCSAGHAENSTEAHTAYTTDPGLLQCQLTVATTVTFLTGLIQLGMGLLKAGFLSTYLSMPLAGGFTAAIGVHMLVSQLPFALGYERATTRNGEFRLINSLLDILWGVRALNVADLVTCFLCVVCFIITNNFISPRMKAKTKLQFPSELIILILTTTICCFTSLESTLPLKVLGTIPSQLPRVSLPDVRLVPAVLVDAFSIAVVSFASNISLMRLLRHSQSHTQPVHANQEFVAYGAANIGSALLSGHVSAAGLSRSLLQRAVGGATQATSLIACLVMALVIHLAGPFFQHMPLAVLTAITMTTLLRTMQQLKDLGKLWKFSKYDFFSWLSVFIAVIVLDVTRGLLLGFIFTLMTVVFRTQSPYTCILGRIADSDLYKDLTVYHDAKEVAGMKIFRFTGPLYYANSAYFLSEIYKKTALNPAELKKVPVKTTDDEQSLRGHVSFVVLDCSAMTYIDSVGVGTLLQVYRELHRVDITLLLAGCEAAMHVVMKDAGLLDVIPGHHLFITLHDATLIASAIRSDPQLEKDLCVN